MWACPSYSGCDSEIAFPLDAGCKRQGIKLKFELNTRTHTCIYLCVYIHVPIRIHIIIYMVHLGYGLSVAA